MSADFHEVRFPTDISYGSAGGPQFSTEVIVLGSGHERRDKQWEYPRQLWDVAYGVKEKAQLTTLIEFFLARKGRAIGFRFKNHDDYQGTDEEIGMGDGETADFQLVKTYTSGPGSLEYQVTKPVAGTTHIYLDSVEQMSGWSVDTTTGIVTLDSGSVPSSGEVVTATYEYDLPVRFDTDHLPVNFTTYGGRGATVPIIEVRVAT